MPKSHDEIDYPQLALRGTVTFVGDVIAPVLPEEYWESLDPASDIKPPPPPLETSS